MTSTAGGPPARTTTTTNSRWVLDRWASSAQHLRTFLLVATLWITGQFPANPSLLGFFLPNAAPTVMRTALRGTPPVGTATMTTDPPQNAQSPLALRPRDAARMLGVSPRTLWGWTRARIVPCVRVGTGKRRTVLYPVADLRAWLTRQTEAGK